MLPKKSHPAAISIPEQVHRRANQPAGRKWVLVSRQLWEDLADPADDLRGLEAQFHPGRSGLHALIRARTRRLQVGTVHVPVSL